MPGPFTNKVMEKAQRHNLYIYFTMFERAPESQVTLYNTGFFAMPSGKVVIYRKMHLVKLKTFDEAFYVKPGEEFKVVDTRLGKIGLQICFDITQPESARVVTLMGAEIILHPNAWPEEGSLRYELLVPARAAENQLYVASCGQCGPYLYGHSRLVDYAGKELIKFGREEGVKSASIHLDEQQRWRRDYLPYLSRRRPDKYTSLCSTAIS